MGRIRSRWELVQEKLARLQKEEEQKERQRNQEINSLEKAIAAKRSLTDILSLALLRFGKGHYDRSLELVREYLSFRPDDIDALHLKASIYEKLGDAQSEYPLHRRILSLDPKNSFSEERATSIERNINNTIEVILQSVLAKHYQILEQKAQELCTYFESKEAYFFKSLAKMLKNEPDDSFEQFLQLSPKTELPLRKHRIRDFVAAVLEMTAMPEHIKKTYAPLGWPQDEREYREYIQREAIIRCAKKYEPKAQFVQYYELESLYFAREYRRIFDEYRSITGKLFRFGLDRSGLLRTFLTNDHLKTLPVMDDNDKKLEFLNLSMVADSFFVHGHLGIARMIYEYLFSPAAIYDSFIPKIIFDQKLLLYVTFCTEGHLCDEFKRLWKAFDAGFRFENGDRLMLSCRQLGIFDEAEQFLAELQEYYNGLSGSDPKRFLVDAVRYNAGEFLTEWFLRVNHKPETLRDRFYYDVAEHKQIGDYRIREYAWHLAVNLFVAGYDALAIKNEINGLFPEYEPIREINVSPSELHIKSFGGGETRLIETYHRSISKDVTIFVSEYYVGGQWIDQQKAMVQWARKHEAAIEESEGHVKEEGLADDGDLHRVAELLANTATLPVPSEWSDIRSQFYVSPWVMKVFSQVGPYTYELAAMKWLAGHPVIRAPKLQITYITNAKYVIQEFTVVGFGLHETLQYLRNNSSDPLNRRIAESLLTKHLFDTTNLQMAHKLWQPSDLRPSAPEVPQQTDQNYSSILMGIMSQHAERIDLSINSAASGNVLSIAEFLEKRQSCTYRDASLFNAIVDYRMLLSRLSDFADVPDEYFAIFESLTGELDIITRREHLDRIHSFIGKMTGDKIGIEDLEELFADSLVQIDFSSMSKRAFPLEDVILAVDNIYVMPAADELKHYVTQYLSDLHELFDQEVEDIQRQLALGGFYRQLKMYHYLSTGHLVLSENSEADALFYIRRAYKYLLRYPGMPSIDEKRNPRFEDILDIVSQYGDIVS